MTAWKTNPDWDKPIPRGELCGRVSDRYTPCPHPRPCPTHDAGSLLEGDKGGAGVIPFASPSESEPDEDSEVPSSSMAEAPTSVAAPVVERGSVALHVRPSLGGRSSDSPSRAPATFTPRLSAFDPWRDEA